MKDVDYLKSNNFGGPEVKIDMAKVLYVRRVVCEPFSLSLVIQIESIRSAIEVVGVDQSANNLIVIRYSSQ